jgi:hypothetical protein
LRGGPGYIFLQFVDAFLEVERYFVVHCLWPLLSLRGGH